MAKILVKKSVPKGVLVKQVQPQLMQTPDKGKGFMDFFNTFRNKDKNPNIGVKQRLAGLAGMAGKIGAGLSTVNDTMQAMQGGNISAPLGMGYTFEAKDPTGRMISEAANPSQPKPEPTVQANLPKTSLGRGGDLPTNIRQQVDERKERERLLAQMANPAPGSAMDQMNQRRNQLQAQAAQTNQIYTRNLPQKTPELQARQDAFHNSVLQNMPTPTSAPIPPQPNVSIDPLDTMRTSNAVSSSNAVPPNMPPVPTTQLPPLPQSVSTAPATPPVQQPTTPQQTGQVAQQTGQVAQQTGQVPQQTGEVSHLPGNQGMLLSPEEIHQQNLMGGTFQNSFVTALTEKLGADVVYKMSPHEIGTFAAYTLLKLR